MAAYNSLGATGQEYILEEQYKALFGYPNGKVNSSLNLEVPGTSRPFILQNQIYSEKIPITAPTDLGDTATITIAGVTASYQSSNAYPYLKKYYDVPLIPVTSYTDPIGSLTWWFAAAGATTDRSKQLEYNILSQGVPNNFDPDNGYRSQLTIDNIPRDFGNSQYPWTYNVNSGIVLFTGYPMYPKGTDPPSNNTPRPDSIITMTFWRYNGATGTPSATTYWQAITTPISGIGYGALSVGTDPTGSIYTQNILANDTTANVNLYTNLTTIDGVGVTGSLTIGSATSTCQINSKTTFSQIPECGVTATSGNQLTNKDYVDNTFVTAAQVYQNNPQDIYGQKVFTGNISGNNPSYVYFNNLIYVRNILRISDKGNFNTNYLVDIYESDTSLNFDPQFNSNNYNFYTKNSVGARVNTLKIEYDTSTFNSALVVGGTATFNTYVPECGVTATSGNQLTNKDYVDDNFVDVTSTQSVGGTKTFTNDMLTTNIFTNNLVWKLNSTNDLDPTLHSTLTYNSNTNKNELYFHPYFKNNSYKFQCSSSDGVSDKSLFITFEKTTIQTALEVGGTATFNTYVPECSVGATSGNQLTNKTYVDEMLSKIGSISYASQAADLSMLAESASKNITSITINKGTFILNWNLNIRNIEPYGNVGSYRILQQINVGLATDYFTIPSGTPSSTGLTIPNTSNELIPGSCSTAYDDTNYLRVRSGTYRVEHGSCVYTCTNDNMIIYLNTYIISNTNDWQKFQYGGSIQAVRLT